MACLIKGKSIGCSEKSRIHYLEGPENEKITVHEVSGFATQDAHEALAMLELSAKGTKCNKPVYSAKINPETDRLWTPEERQQAIDRLEKNLGLTDHPRVVIEHLKKGRVHYHVLWSRFHPDGGAAKNMGNDYAIHQKTQKEIEKAFKLRPMMAKGRDFKQWEVEWAKRYGFDVFKLRDQITVDFNKAKTGHEFLEALKAKGMVLCRGDKGQFILILPWSQHKALSSMIMSRPTKAILRRALDDIDIAKLPTVPEGKTLVKANLPKIVPKLRSSAKAKRRAGKSAHTYIRKHRGVKKGVTAQARRNRIFMARWGSKPPSRSWRPYGSFLTRHHGVALKAGTLHKNRTTPHAASLSKFTKTTIISKPPTTAPNHGGQVENQNGTVQENENTTNITGGINPNSANTETSLYASTEKLSPQTGATRTAASTPNSSASPPPFGGKGWMDLFRTAKHAAEERQQPTTPFRPSSGNMSPAQLIDLKAAEEGKITWAEYFKLWGRGGVPSP